METVAGGEGLLVFFPAQSTRASREGLRRILRSAVVFAANSSVAVPGEAGPVIDTREGHCSAELPCITANRRTGRCAAFETKARRLCGHMPRKCPRQDRNRRTPHLSNLSVAMI